MMHPTALEIMHDQVRAIYRAVTGADLAEPEEVSEADPTELRIDELTRRFSDLEAIARSVPAVVQRVPPFSFSPQLDVIEAEREILIEVAVPGVGPEDVTVELAGTTLTVTGVRRGERAADGHTYFHAEIPRGPFRRTIPLPFEPADPPRVEVDRGMVVVHVTKQPAPPAQQ